MVATLALDDIPEYVSTEIVTSMPITTMTMRSSTIVKAEIEGLNLLSKSFILILV